MNDGKVYRMPEDVEDQYLTEDSKIRLYLSPVRYGKPEKRKERVLEKITAAALALVHSIFITDIAGQWMIQSAARCRGYDAIGGEYILIIVVFTGSFRAMWKLLKNYRRQA